MENRKFKINEYLFFVPFFAGCILTFFLSTLWSKPGYQFNIAGAIGALLQTGGLIFFIREYFKLKSTCSWQDRITQLVLVLILVKSLAQLISAAPQFAGIIYVERNLQVAYLHFVLLGIVTAFVLSSIIDADGYNVSTGAVKSFYLFLAAFFSTELLLVVEVASRHNRFSIHRFPEWLFYCSALFPVAIIFLILSLRTGPFRSFTHRSSATL